MFPVRAQQDLAQPIPPPPELDLWYPPESGWAWVNQETGVVTPEIEGLAWTVTPAGGLADIMGRVRNYTAPITVDANLRIETRTGNESGTGIGFRESSTGKIVVLYWAASSSGRFFLNKWTNPTTFSSGVDFTSLSVDDGYALQAEDDNTNLYFRVSAIGRQDTWDELWSESRTAFMAGGPDQIGWFSRDPRSNQKWILRAWREL